ncbi:hypothetical protein ACFO3D_04520 [Virgibacillus kekensis]|uniref:Excalibur calcium-binding domain-containing protein n=1 Tax=Virgibacillus kekensis TaxID=202261 RepID=A0ABV9DF82_9BACI
MTHSTWTGTVGDFSTHEQAQAFFIAAGGPGDDPHRLDGLACESLP